MIGNALVTGASGGIGRAIAIRLAAQNLHVWVHYHHSKARAEETASIIRASGGVASLVCFDVSDGKCSRDVLDSILEEVGAFDVLVLNAGVSDDVAFPGMTESQWSRVIETSLNSFYYVTAPLIMPMIRKRWGRIVSISSVAALHGNRGQVNYAAAKAGLIGACRSLAREVAGRGICVNVVAPGYIQTSMIDALPGSLIEQNVPMKRAGSADEVAAVVAFLCSKDASYITGEVINVSGGII